MEDISVVAASILIQRANYNTDQFSSEVMINHYMIALDDIPAWSVKEAWRLWLRDECGEGFNCRYKPEPSDLRKVALSIIKRVEWRIKTYNSILAAVIDEPSAEMSELDRGKMTERLESALSGLGIKATSFQNEGTAGE